LPPLCWSPPRRSGRGFGSTAAVERDIADISSRLVSEAALANPDDPETVSGIGLSPSNVSASSTSAPT
jgi:hypothetical protein